MTTTQTDSWHAEARRERRRTAWGILGGLVLMVALLMAYPLLTHDERACPQGEHPVVQRGVHGKVGLCVADGERPPVGFRRYPAHRVPVLANDLYRPTLRDYLRYGDEVQKRAARDKLALPAATQN